MTRGRKTTPGADHASWHGEYDDLIAQAWASGDYHAGIRHLLAAGELADAHQDVERAYHARYRLLGTAMSHGLVDESIAAFGWCLGAVDRDPERLREAEAEGADGSGLYAHYKYLVALVTETALIPRAQAEAVFTDFQARYARLGAGAQTVAHSGYFVYDDLGEDEIADQYGERAHTLPVDDLSSTPGHQADLAVRYHLRRGDIDQALRAGQGDSNELLLVPLLAAGRGEVARGMMPAILRSVRDDCYGVYKAVQAIRFLSLTGNHARAWALHLRYAPHAVALGPTIAAWSHAVAAEELATCLALAGTASVHGALPAEFTPCGQGTVADGGARAWPVPDLQRSFAARADALTAAFDARNGNRTFSRRRQERLAQVGTLRCDLPLTWASAERPVQPGRADTLVDADGAG